MLRAQFKQLAPSVGEICAVTSWALLIIDLMPLQLCCSIQHVRQHIVLSVLEE